MRGFNMTNMSQNEQKEAFVPAACKVPKTLQETVALRFFTVSFAQAFVDQSRASAHSIPTVWAGFMLPLTGNFND